MARAQTIHARGEAVKQERSVAADMSAVIQVRDLDKTYQDGTHAVKGVSFDVEKGEVFGLLGPNGAGKTTTMRILGTLHRPTSGSAHVLGLDVVHDASELRKRIGFAMQEVGMDDLATAEEMLMLHARLYGVDRDEARQQARRLLKTFDLEKHSGRRVMRFSGGMQRRLDLAVSLIHQPDVLFLDEPSTGLDPTSRAALWRVLRRLRDEHGITVLMSTHYMEEADALCDRIAVMSQGEIAAIDTPANLKRSVGADTITITLDSEPHNGQEESLRETFGAQNVRFTDHQMVLKVTDGGRALMPALQIIHDAGLKVRNTTVHTPTLDDVFRIYTGESLTEEKEDLAEAAA